MTRGDWIAVSIGMIIGMLVVAVMYAEIAQYVAHIGMHCTASHTEVVLMPFYLDGKNASILPITETVCDHWERD